MRPRRDGPDLSTRFDRAVGSVGTLASRAGAASNDLAGEVGVSVDDPLTKPSNLHGRLRQPGNHIGPWACR